MSHSEEFKLDNSDLLTNPGNLKNSVKSEVADTYDIQKVLTNAEQERNDYDLDTFLIKQEIETKEVILSDTDIGPANSENETEADIESSDNCLDTSNFYVSGHLSKNCQSLHKNHSVEYSIGEKAIQQSNCFILYTNNYNCVNCTFTTESIKEAVLHYLYNGSESISVSNIIYNIKTNNLKCDVCNFTTGCKDLAKNHWEEHLPNIFLKCFMCTYSTLEDCLLKAHLVCHLNEMKLIQGQRKHNDDRAFVCIMCGFNIMSTNRDFIKRHYLRVHGRARYICGQCPTHKYYYYENLKIHVDRKHKEQKKDLVYTKAEYRSQHKALNTTQLHEINLDMEYKVLDSTQLFKKIENSYKCRFCSFSAVLIRLINEHIKSAHSDKIKKKEKRFVCNICKNKFKTVRILKKHIQVFHESAILECMNCDFRSKHKSALIKHMEHHTGQLSQLCYVCGFQNSNERTMNAHIFRHSGVKKLFCDKCNYKCFNTHSLSRHIQTHSIDRPYFCNLCSYQSTQKEYIKNHLLSHAEIKSKTKLHKCHICNYSTPHKNSLKSHEKTHSINRKRFHCQECGKEYLKEGSLKRHKLTHLDFKPYKCAICKDSFFVSKQGLLNHLKVHTGEGRMYCFECNYSSVHKGNFIEHVNKTCQNARHAHLNLRKCYHCSFASGHRSNFTAHVIRCYKKI